MSLGADCPPRWYVVQYPILNGIIVGVNRSFTTLANSTVATINHDELIPVIRHEIGNCLSGHALYKTLRILLLQLFLAYHACWLSGGAADPLGAARFGLQE